MLLINISENRFLDMARVITEWEVAVASTVRISDTLSFIIKGYLMTCYNV